MKCVQLNFERNALGKHRGEECKVCRSVQRVKVRGEFKATNEALVRQIEAECYEPVYQGTLGSMTSLSRRRTLGRSHSNTLYSAFHIDVIVL
jgi:hypothetical protein